MIKKWKLNFSKFSYRLVFSWKIKVQSWKIFAMERFFLDWRDEIREKRGATENENLKLMIESEGKIYEWEHYKNK